MSFNWIKKEREEDEKPKPRRHYKMPNGEKAILNSRGLIPVILQEARTMMPLHLGYMDYWALDTTLQEKTAYLYRRSLKQLQKFGKDKGLEYEVKSIILNAGRRALLVLVICKDGKEPYSSFNKVCFPTAVLPAGKEDLFVQETSDADSIFPEIESDDSFFNDPEDDSIDNNDPDV